MAKKHIPVLLGQVIDHLQPRQGQKFIDCTLGAGSYTLALADKVGEGGMVAAIDRDEIAINDFKKTIADKKIGNITVINGNFGELKALLAHYFKSDIRFNGIVFDLGLSSDQLEDSARGFSFRGDHPLNMAFSSKKRKKTEEIVNTYKKEDLARIIREFGEERFAGRIADKIVEERKKQPLKTTGQLKEIIKKSIPSSGSQRIHPATRTFQALRIATNEELTNLQKALPQAVDLLEPKGRIAVVSYHSLEDRIVKNFFKQEAKDCICPPEAWQCQCDHKAQLKIITKKIIAPEEKEVRTNPRARSAKLRVAEKL
jgi:16S rRNA (cytosine1402-N4)-methyltransferase